MVFTNAGRESNAGGQLCRERYGRDADSILATDANGNITTTADDIKNLIAGDTTFSSMFSTQVSGDGSGTVQGSAALR